MTSVIVKIIVLQTHRLFEPEIHISYVFNKQTWFAYEADQILLALVLLLYNMRLKTYQYSDIFELVVFSYKHLLSDWAMCNSTSVIQ